jgi:hypothetical protein
MTTRTTPEDLWRHLVDEAGEEEIERAASVSVAEAEAYLTKAGFDVKAERARAEAFLTSLGGEDEASAKPARRPMATAVWVAAATAAAVGAGTYATTVGPLAAHPAPSAAEILRQHAVDALRDGKAAECLKLLDEAKTKDPAGDAAPEVTELRRRANEAIGPSPGR